MGFSIFRKLLPNKFWSQKSIDRRMYSDEFGKLQSSHKVNTLEKRFLVWTGKYKTLEEVPAFVTQAVMERTRNRMRIRIANYMMAATALGCCLMVYLGKQDHKAGRSLQQENIEWHRKLKEEEDLKKAKAAQLASQ